MKVSQRDIADVDDVLLEAALEGMLLALARALPPGDPVGAYVRLFVTTTLEAIELKREFSAESAQDGSLPC